MLFTEEMRLMRERYVDYLQNIEHKPKWRRKLMDIHWRWRSQVYSLLEKPKTLLGVCYHILVFIFILIIHTSSSVISHQNDNEKQLKFMASLEEALAFYFLVEFFLRLWSAGADGRFQGWQGRKKFLLQPMCIIDTMILSLSVAVLFFAEHQYSGRFLEILRFIQILRFLHIDRQMISWTLLRNLIQRSSFELTSIYYIALVIFALMACLVFTIEANQSKGGLQPDSENTTFSNYGEAFWFSAISIFTIGYGDIVPEQGLTKLVVCVFSYVGLCCFGAASTLSGVGLSLMLDHRNKVQKQSKVRNLAATTIQIWYRYHLINRERTFNSISIYATFCMNLSRFEERMKLQRLSAKRYGVPSVKPQKPHKKNFFINSVITSNNQLTVSSEYDLKHALCTVPAIFVSSTEINEDQDHNSTHSLTHADSELQILARKIAADNQLRRGSTSLNLQIKPEKKHLSLARLLSRKVTHTNPQLSENQSYGSVSDVMDSQDYENDSADEQSFGSCLTISENVSLLNSVVPMLTGKYRCILRIVHYLRFMVLRRRFKRIRMPYELDDAEDELCELEHRRMHAFKQLEKKLSQLLGRQRSEREKSDENEVMTQSKKSLIVRIDECEVHLSSIEIKARKLEESLLNLVELIQTKTNDNHVDFNSDNFVLNVPSDSLFPK